MGGEIPHRFRSHAYIYQYHLMEFSSILLRGIATTRPGRAASTKLIGDDYEHHLPYIPGCISWKSTFRDQSRDSNWSALQIDQMTALTYSFENSTPQPSCLHQVICFSRVWYALGQHESTTLTSVGCNAARRAVQLGNVSHLVPMSYPVLCPRWPELHGPAYHCALSWRHHIRLGGVHHQHVSRSSNRCSHLARFYGLRKGKFMGIG
jgi:hypothetical protein